MFGKTELLEAIAGKNRGLLASDADRQVIQAAALRLEEHNPTPRPLESDALDGNWRLLYTTSQELLQIDQFPLLTLGQIYQYVRVQDATIYNIAEVTGPPFLEGIVSVVARFEPVSVMRVNVRFERGIFGLQRLIGYQSATSFVQAIESGKRFAAIDFAITNPNQKGWLEITYLDQDLRISRGNEGSLFVLTKVQ